MSDEPELSSLEEFFFDLPLYAPVKLRSDLELAERLYNQSSTPVRLDGYCPNCNRLSTFTLHQSLSSSYFAYIDKRFAFDNGYLECVRSANHRIYHYWRIRNLVVEKVGQYPSLATITNDQLAGYRKIMSREDAAEFFKATGLAAHGVGIGSFVYLRRVFERLIYKRFEEFRVAEGWDEDAFRRSRMVEKITLLKDHLPDFLVQNAKIYSILSIGIHSLSEERCAAFFEVLKDSIVTILEDDKKKKEELGRRDRLAAAIKELNFSEEEEDVEAEP